MCADISFKPASLSEDQPGALQYEQHATGKLLAEFRNRSRTSEVVRMQGKYTCLKETECVLVFDGSSFRLERLAGAGNQLQLRSSFPASASPAAASHKADQTSSPPPSSSSSPPAAPAADAAVSTVALKRPRSSVAGKTPASSSSSSSSSSSLLSNGISAKRPRTSYDDGSEEEEEEDEEEEEEVGQDIQNLATQLELDLDEAPAPSLETSAPADGRGIGMQQPPNSLFSEDEDEAGEGPPTLTSSVSARTCVPPRIGGGGGGGDILGNCSADGARLVFQICRLTYPRARHWRQRLRASRCRPLMVVGHQAKGTAAFLCVFSRKQATDARVLPPLLSVSKQQRQ